MKKPIALAALLAALAWYGSVATANPGSRLASFAPFQSFGAGEGHGYARHYRNRSMQELVGLLRNPAQFRQEMRVSCEIWVRQIAEAHPGLPWESCEGAAASLERDQSYQFVACSDGALQSGWLAVTNAAGTAFGVWHRRCLPSEYMLAWRGQLLASVLCMNAFVPGAPAAPASQQAAAPVAAGPCPNGFSIVLHVWALSTLPSEMSRLAMEIVAEAQRRNTQNTFNVNGYQGRAFSRTLGRQMRFDERVKHAQVAAQIEVNYRNPATMQVTRRVGFIQVWGGRGEIRLPDDPRTNVVELVLPDEFITSPMSGGRRRLMDLPTEWPECIQNMHAGVMQ